MRDPRGGVIPHRHHGPNGPITTVNPKDPGAWPGDPAHYDPNYYPRPLEIPHWVCEMGVHVGCHVLCEGIAHLPPAACFPVCIAAAAFACLEKCEGEKNYTSAL
jgi:hypothetical protein